jgi:phosphoserine phosphatase RsbU/P
LGIVVGDVSGHGIGPALLAAETRAYVRALTRISSDVAQIATTVNRLLWEDTSGFRFATLFLAWIDAKARTLVHVGAGHCAYLIHPSGEFTTLRSQTAPLGIFDSTTFKTDEPVTLHTGDILLMCTDGLFEVGAPRSPTFWQRAVHRTDPRLSQPAGRKDHRRGAARRTDVRP